MMTIEEVRKAHYEAEGIKKGIVEGIELLANAIKLLKQGIPEKQIIKRLKCSEKIIEKAKTLL